MINISEQTLALMEHAEEDIAPVFSQIDKIAQENTAKVLDAFHEFRVSETHFVGTTGYGYDDRGRDTLDQIYARVFGCEDALVRINFVNGTHALTAALFAVLRPGDVLLSAVGAPYDTLQTAIGISGDEPGNLHQFGVSYRQVNPAPDGGPDYKSLSAAASDPQIKAVLIQRSRGYTSHPALTTEQIGRIVQNIRSVNPSAVVLVDNCYGEFVETQEPGNVGADLTAGSLIKNPGGGLCLTGGYIAGRHDLVEAAAMRLTSPGIGRECGCTLDQNRSMYQGLFMAPHTTAQALKTAVFCSRMMELLGYKTAPSSTSTRSDIVQTVEFGNAEALCRFCRGIQAGAPVDAFVTPEPWDMPGYSDQVVMAAGSFVQGASIELSADGPMRPPYTAYMQGGLTWESGKIGVLLAVEELLKG